MLNLKKINDLLDKKRLSKRELSNYIEKNENTLQNYLTGKTKIEVETLEKISKFLEVPIGYFFDESEPKGNINNNGIQLNGVNNGNIQLSAAIHEIENLKLQLEASKREIELLREINEMLKKK